MFLFPDRIDRGRLPHPSGVKVKKLCRRLSRPPAQTALKRGGPKRYLPSPTGSNTQCRDQYTSRSKRRGLRSKPRPHRKNTDAYSETANKEQEEHQLQPKFICFPVRDETDATALVEEIPEAAVYGSRSDKEESEPQISVEADSDSDMEARRRRRLLERVARVSCEDAALTAGNATTSWRSKVYNDEVASRPDIEVGGPRRRSKDSSRRSSRDSCDLNNAQDTIGFTESRESDEAASGDLLRRRSSRRLSDDSNCSDQLSERLAKRRAQRLEEAGDSSSLDSSFDSPRVHRNHRRQSQGGTERSEVGSHENGYQVKEGEFEVFRRKSRSFTGARDETNASRTSSGTTSTPSVRRDPCQRSRDSAMSMDSNDPAEGDEEDDGESEEIRSLRRRRKLRRKQSEDSNTGGAREGVEDTKGRRSRNAMRWGDPDYNFPSSESNGSFRSCEEWSSSGQWTSKDSRTFSEDAPQGTVLEPWPLTIEGVINRLLDNNQVNHTSNNNNIINNNNNHNTQNGTTLSTSSSCGDIYSLAPTSGQSEGNNNVYREGNSNIDQVTQISAQTDPGLVDAHGQSQEVCYFFSFSLFTRYA